MAFRHRSQLLHLPRVQKRAGGEFLSLSDTLAASSTSLACKSETEVDYYRISTPLPRLPPPSHGRVRRRCIPASSTSLACKSEPEVGFFRVSTLIPPPSPPLQVSLAFRPCCRSSTSLACKSEPEAGFSRVWKLLPPPPLPLRGFSRVSTVLVGFYGVSAPFAPSPPPLHARARRRWFFTAFRRPSRHRHLPRMQQRAGGGFFTPFRRCSHHRHLPCMPEVVFYGVSMPFASPPPPSHARASRSRFLRYFDALHITTTSLACNSEPEVVFYGVSMPFASPPPPSHATASRRCFFTAFRHRSRHHHLPREPEVVF
jgi:hypothetical protein